MQDLIQSVQKPRLSVTDWRVTDFDFRELELTFDVTVDNPNALAVQMLSYGYGLEINGRPFVSGSQEQETRIEASGQSTFELPMRVNFRDLYGAVGSLAGRDEAAYAFSSTFAFDLPGLGRTEVPVRREGTLPLLRLPGLRIAGLQVVDLGLGTADLSLNLEFDNPNGIGFRIDGFDYNLNINGNRWAEGSALEGITVAEQGVTRLEIPVKLNVAEVGVSVFRMLSGSQEVDYEFNGNFTLGAGHPLLGSTEFQVNREGRLSLTGGN